MLTVRRGPWAIVNVHAESGGLARESRERGAQLLHMSRLHECDEDRAYVIAGDFNVRAGEDHRLLTEGWVDAWHTCSQAADVEDWTWRKGGHTARYDHIYIRKDCECISMTRLLGVWKHLSDYLEVPGRPASLHIA